MRQLILFLAFVVFVMLSCRQTAANSTANSNTGSVSEDACLYLLIGTYTDGESEGIYVYQFDTISGYSSYKNKVKVCNPSYLTISKDGKYVYSVTETGDSKAAANSFAFDKANGSLRLLNSLPTKGADPCYIEIDAAGKRVITANYSGGSITTFEIKEDGSLNNPTIIEYKDTGIDPKRQTQSHIHCVRFSPDEKYLFATDLGLDQIHKFKIRSAGINYLTEGIPSYFKVPNVSGPRHLDFHPCGKFAYLINELSGAVTVFGYDAATGNLSELQSIQADTLNARGSADIHVSPDGKFLYASNRSKNDGIAIFSINQANGKLTKIAYQQTESHPRNFAITPNGKFLLVACRNSDVIQVFLINRTTGLLKNTNKDIKLDMPVCLKFTSLK